MIMMTIKIKILLGNPLYRCGKTGIMAGGVRSSIG